MDPALFLSLFIFLLGLIVGSFLNVCIHRLPLGESVVRPRSRCPQCKALIAAYDNVPVLSYLILGGRCRHCRARISPLYPLVELMTATVFLLSFLGWGLTPLALKSALLGGALITLTITDLHERILPDAVNFPFMGLGLLFAFWIPVNDGAARFLLVRLFEVHLPAAAFSLADALLGALVGGGILLGLGELWYRLRGVEAMGFGDVKMMTMVGLFFGLKLTVLTLLLGSLVGSVVGGLFILLSGKDTQYELPLGTFLGLAGLLALFWGRPMIAAYLSLFPS